MLWSLLKVLLFVLAIAAISFGANFLLNTDAGLQISFAGWEFSLGPLQASIAALVFLALMWAVMRLAGLLVAVLRFVTGDETALSRYFDRNRERKGYAALNEGLIALAAGEGRLALLRVQRAEKYLAKPEITALLIAQAAEVAGDTAKASAAYKTLLANDATRFVGVRGLMRQKLAEGDHETALKLAEKAYALRPKHSETQDILLQLQSQSADWAGARATLGAKLRAGSLPKDLYRRRDAVMALQQAKGVLDDTASIEAREAAIDANKKSPDLIPAAAMAARALIEKGDIKSAERILKKAWAALPHPDLAAAFAEIAAGEQTGARIKRFAALVKAQPDHPESRMTMAELHIAAEDFPAARRALGDLPDTDPTQRALVIMAAIERGMGSDDAVVRGWMARALTAPRGPQWCCDACQAIHSEWMPTCNHCSGFDTLSWRAPAEVSGASATGAELLPLMVAAGKPTPPQTDARENDQPIIDLEAVARSAS
ncbi:MAG: heme biosynthesis protein HemY [Cypionkella sp.]